MRSILRTLPIAFLALLLTFAAAHADQLACQASGDGWGLVNVTKKFWYGNGVYFNYSNCLTALNSVRATNKFGVVCAPHPDGSGIYSVYSGKLLGTDSFYYKVDVCATAVRAMSDWVICVPSAPGSVLLDLRTNVISSNYYYSIEACKWASASASSNDNLVCSPADGGSRIVDRRTGEEYSWFRSAENCYRSLRGK